MIVVKSLVESVLTDDVVEMQFADYQVPGYRQDPAVIGNAGCYRVQVNWVFRSTLSNLNAGSVLALKTYGRFLK